MDSHVCRAEAAPDVWQAMDYDPLVGTADCRCCGLTPGQIADQQAKLPPFSKVVIEPQLHVHRGQRGGPVLKSVQCDYCGDTDFARRCRQCGALFKLPRPIEGIACENCDRMAREAGAENGFAVDDWEEVSPA